MTEINSPWKDRFRAAGIHFSLSLAVAALAALVVFFIWYPYPYREISGGRELFFLVVTVDVIMGPLLTLAVFNRKKPWKVMRRDLAVIGILQLAALSYGMWTVAVARPVHLAYEIDRFRVVHAIDVDPDLLARSAPEFRRLPLLGPTLLSVRPFKDAKESFDATIAAVSGASLGARPDLWQSYAAAKSQVIEHARPVAALKARFPARAAEIDAALKSSGWSGDEANVGFIPLVSRSTFWTVLIDRNTTGVIAFVPIDPY